MTPVRTILVPILAALALLAGCQRTPRMPIEITGTPIRPDLATDVEVVNWNGSVSIIANPKYTSPEVRAQVRRLTKDAPKSTRLRETVNVDAVATIEGGRRLIRVKGTPTGTATEEQIALDLIVRVARAQDVRVSTLRGDVWVTGWAGALNVINGPGGTPGGNIQARTQFGITSDVTLNTTQGNIIYRSGPGTTGRFDLEGGPKDATAKANIQIGRVTNARPDPRGRSYSGTLDNGANPITLRSDGGSVQIDIVENAGQLGPDLWDGYPDPKKGPKIWRVLSGGEEWRPAWRKEPTPRAPAPTPATTTP